MRIKTHSTANFVQKFAKKYSRLVRSIVFQGDVGTIEPTELGQNNVGPLK